MMAGRSVAMSSPRSSRAACSGRSIHRRGRAPTRSRPRLVLHHHRARARRVLRVGVAVGVRASRAANAPNARRPERAGSPAVHLE